MAYAYSRVRLRGTCRQRRRQRHTLPLLVFGWSLVGLLSWLVGEIVIKAEPAALAMPAPAPQDFDHLRVLDTVQHLTRTIGVRPAGSEGERRAGLYLRQRLIEFGYETRLQQNLSLDQGDGVTCNVIGLRRGPQHDRRVLIGAHYDSKGREGCVGANDNASGVAVTLELARLLATAELPFGLEIVFFGGEEQRGARSLVGSRAYVARCRRDLPAAMLSVDMVGRGEHLSALYVGRGGKRLAEQVHDSARALALPLSMCHDPGGSDHVSFAAAGVPSVWLWRGPDSANHTWRDRAGRLQPEALEETGRLLTHFLLSSGPTTSSGAAASPAGSVSKAKARPGSLTVAPGSWYRSVLETILRPKGHSPAAPRKIYANAIQVTDLPADIPGRSPLPVLRGLGGNYGRTVRTAIRGCAFAADRLATGRASKSDTATERARSARAGPSGAG